MPKKITKLTDSDRARFKEWSDRWIKIGLSTDEADWESFEKGVNECYLLSNLTPVKIIRAQSPIVGAFASPIAALILAEGNKGSAVHSAVHSAVDSAVHSAVYSAVDFAVGSAVHSAVYSAVHSAVHSAVYSAVYSAVGSAVHSAVDFAVHSAVHSAVDFAVDSAVYSAVGSAVDFAVGSAVHSAVDFAVDSAVYSAVGSAKNLFWHYWMAGQFWSSWQAYVTFFTDVLGWAPEGDILRRIRAYELAEKSACYWWPNKDFVMVCNRPKHIHRNKEGQLHSETEQAIEWRDGWGLFMLNGVRVSKELVMTSAENLDPLLISKEQNAEIRREIVRKIGIERVCQKLGSKTLESRWGYDLLTLNLVDGRNRPYLKMKNPSTGTYHLEGIEPSIKTVEQALAWRNGEKKYREPFVLT